MSSIEQILKTASLEAKLKGLCGEVVPFKNGGDGGHLCLKSSQHSTHKCPCGTMWKENDAS
jgi:hypothetical protein